MLKRRYKPKPKTDLPEFFQKHEEKIKTTRAKCMECGCEFKGGDAQEFEGDLYCIPVCPHSPRLPVTAFLTGSL